MCRAVQESHVDYVKSPLTTGRNGRAAIRASLTPVVSGLCPACLWECSTASRVRPRPRVVQAQMGVERATNPYSTRNIKQQLVPYTTCRQVFEFVLSYEDEGMDCKFFHDMSRSADGLKRTARREGIKGGMRTKGKTSDMQTTP